jgi:NADH-quinone oxidoreductase subunit C
VITREVPAAEWAQSARLAREEGFTFFDWLSAVDQTDQEDPGLDVLCHLIRPRPWQRLLLRTRVAEGAPLDSLTGVFAGAAWHEREAHEMFGLQLTGFDDGTGQGLRPLLLPDGFEGTPLRKSFVLAARASKAWPGAKEPGESESGTGRRSPSRRRLLPPGVPDPSWGPR